MIKRIKFTGDFKKLIPMGFQFQKLYASNYRCYHNYEIVGLLQPFWIWVKERRFEIDDWYEFAVPILEFCQTHTMIPRILKTNVGDITIDTFTLLCNKQTSEVREKVYETDDPMRFFNMEDKGEITNDECTRLMKEHRNTYREIIVDPVELLAQLKPFEGMYEIVEDKFRTKKRQNSNPV